MYRAVKEFIKRNAVAYKVYYCVMSFILRVVGCFVPVDNDLVLFVVYGGKRYDDSPRFIYEYMNCREEYRKYKMVWAFIEPNQVEEVPIENKVRIDTLKYFITAMRAKYWITNSSASRGLNFKKKETINILTEHGTACIKKLGKDIVKGNVSFKNGYREFFNYIIIGGKLEEKILRRAWEISGAEILKLGLPRNDELWSLNYARITELKSKFKIPTGKKVILYAPTYREYNTNLTGTYLAPPINLVKWRERLTEQYVLIITAHYEVNQVLDIPISDNFAIMAVPYPHINDLLLMADILISDYSSVIFDYAILERPIISFAYDIDEYSARRGIYDGYDGIFSGGICKTDDDVLSRIESLDYEKEREYTKNNIKNKYLVDGTASAKKVVERVFRIADE